MITIIKFLRQCYCSWLVDERTQLTVWLYSAWVYYREDGTVSKLMTGTFKDGVKISD